MSLADVLNGMKDFDAKKDKVNTNNMNGLPAGEYQAMISDIGHMVYKSGYECIGVIFEVISGNHAGEKEYVNISMAEKSKNGKDIPDFVLERNVKLLMKLDALTAETPVLTARDFIGENETDVHENVAQKLHNRVGKTINLTVITRPNKKDPDNPFKEYELAAAAPIQTADPAGEDIVIPDKDLPF